MFDSIDDALVVASKAEEDSINDPLAYLEDSALEAFAYLKTHSVKDYERYRLLLKMETPLDTRVWTSAVVDKQRKQKNAELAASKKERRERKSRASELADVPVLEIGSHAELAGRLLVRLDTEECPMAYDHQDLHRYDPDNGMWSVIRDCEVSDILQSWDGAMILNPAEPEKVRELQVNSFQIPISMLKHRIDNGLRGEGFFDGAPKTMTFSDITLIVEGDTIVAADHDPDHRALVGLPFAYIPDFPTPLLNQYLEGIFYYDHDAPQKILLLQEFAGAVLFGMGPRYEKALMLHDVGGEGGTGKSQFSTIMEGMLPEGTISSIAPQQLSEEYAGAELRGKRLNSVRETPEDDFLAEAGLKAIIHGEPITRREIRKSPIRFRPIAAHLFACNSLPQAPGTTGAFWDRWMIVEFNRRFRDEEGVVRDIGKKIVERELPGVVAWAVEGAERLLRQDGYTMPDSCKKALRQWQQEARPVQMFIEECCKQIGDVDGDSWTQASQVYEEYQTWAGKNGFGKLNRTNFGRRLGQMGVTKKKSSGVMKYCLRIVEDWESQDRLSGSMPF